MTEWPERSEWIEGDPGPEGDAFVSRMHGLLVTMLRRSGCHCGVALRTELPAGWPNAGAITTVTHGATHHGRGCSMLN